MMSLFDLLITARLANRMHWSVFLIQATRCFCSNHHNFTYWICLLQQKHLWWHLFGNETKRHLYTVNSQDVMWFWSCFRFHYVSLKKDCDLTRWGPNKISKLVDKGLAQSSRKTIIWINDGTDHWRIYTSSLFFIGCELTHTLSLLRLLCSNIGNAFCAMKQNC